MKSDLIVLGVEYVVQIRPQHVLIPGSETTYKERFDSLASLDLDRLPQAAVLEHRRLRGSVERDGLKSRLSRCLGVYPGMLGNEASITASDEGWGSVFLGKRLGTLATAVEKLPRGRFRVEAHYQEQSASAIPVAMYFDASIPEMADVEDEDDDEAIDLWWETHHNGLRDPEGTLSAIVHQSAFKHIHTDDLLDQIDAAARERLAANRAELEVRRRALMEKHAERIVDSAIDQITREGAARPDDDEWEALA